MSVCVTLAAVAVFASAVHAEPIYQHKQVGTFGQAYTWSNLGSGQAFNSADDRFSASFTALEDVEIDAVWQALRSETNNPSVRVSLYTDVAGEPGSVVLNGALQPVTGVGNPSASNFMDRIAFDNSVTLQAGSVYHIVTEFDSFTAGQSFTINRSTADNGIRPFDRAEDLRFSTLVQNDGGSWTTSSTDPSFAFESGGEVVGGPGNPYNGLRSNTFAARGGTTGATKIADGQLFTILDTEVPDGAVVWTDNVTINVTAISGSSPLHVRYRNLDGSIIASGVLAADAGTGEHTILLDAIAMFEQGVSYLITTEIDSASTGDRFLMQGLVGAGPGSHPQNVLSNATWGGDHDTTMLSYPVTSNNLWSSYAANTAVAGSELAFTFTGTVYIPEPGSALVLLLGAVAAARPRLRGARS